MSDAGAPTGLSDVLLKDRPRLLIAARNGFIKAAITVAQGVHKRASANWQQLVLLGAETFPFRARPSTILVSGMPAGVIASVPALEEWGIASRLASTADLPGCYDGEVTQLAALWLQSLPPTVLAELQIVTIDALPELEAVAAALGVPLQSLATTPTLPPFNQS